MHEVRIIFRVQKSTLRQQRWAIARGNITTLRGNIFVQVYIVLSIRAQVADAAMIAMPCHGGTEPLPAGSALDDTQRTIVPFDYARHIPFQVHDCGTKERPQLLQDRLRYL